MEGMTGVSATPCCAIPPAPPVWSEALGRPGVGTCDHPASARDLLWSREPAPQRQDLLRWFEISCVYTMEINKCCKSALPLCGLFLSIYQPTNDLTDLLKIGVGRGSPQSNALLTPCLMQIMLEGGGRTPQGTRGAGPRWAPSPEVVGNLDQWQPLGDGCWACCKLSPEP